MPFFPVRFAVEQQVGKDELAGMEMFLYGYFSFAVVIVRNWISVKFFADGRIKVPHNTVPVILPEIKEISFQEFLGRNG